MNLTAYIKSLSIYPIKSAAAVNVQQLIIDSHIGPVGDRKFMIINADNGMFVSQRSDKGRGIGIKEICMVKPQLHLNHLVVTAPDMEPLSIRTDVIYPIIREAQIWDDYPTVQDGFEEASEWFTKYLRQFKADGKYDPNAQYRLVTNTGQYARKTKTGDAPLNFADGYNLLVTTVDSLDDLNRKIMENGNSPIPMDRFRPNIVLDADCSAYNEDAWQKISVRGMEFYNMGPCFRCATTTVNQQTGKRGREPLYSLHKDDYRVKPGTSDVMFGINLNTNGYGILSVGEQVLIVQ